jgi:hypothetical protein
MSAPRASPGDVLSFQPWPSTVVPGAPAAGTATHAYLIQVEGDSMSRLLEAIMPVLDRLLQEKTARVREQKLEELVDFMAGQMVVPSAVDLKMAQRLAARRTRLLEEFGYATAEQLAEANRSRAANRHALTDNWKKRRQVFSVRHRDEAGRLREVFPLFQFEDYKPIRAVQAVLEAFGDRKSPWKLALCNGSEPHSSHVGIAGRGGAGKPLRAASMDWASKSMTLAERSRQVSITLASNA